MLCRRLQGGQKRQDVSTAGERMRPRGERGAPANWSALAIGAAGAASCASAPGPRDQATQAVLLEACVFFGPASWPLEARARAGRAAALARHKQSSAGLPALQSCFSVRAGCLCETSADAGRTEAHAGALATDAAQDLRRGRARSCDARRRLSSAGGSASRTLCALARSRPSSTAWLLQEENRLRGSEEAAKKGLETNTATLLPRRSRRVS